ncbi:hypothetical protein [Novosphingobium album (ex Liu et al. 2023)]|uniref:UTRA domain-containing protein n=1 Tax=Novosphingobium album (ex Liu et al. 2023) TaxID=3031130 RepID=A0ABT5WKH5_9SPHN|nr:hypothetical protein [Novosphingobium album (ex Liu et al. 2023)]MDE8650550.1 hypothetical protein [Novosphingobium album (ex Liu et al. 2023)]
MVTLMPLEGISRKRRILCSRENALRVAARLFDIHMQPVSIVRTGDPFQPYRITTAPVRGDQVELEMVS